VLFTENKTNTNGFPGLKNESPYGKDDQRLGGRASGEVNPGKQGTKVAADYRPMIESGQTQGFAAALQRSPDRSGPFGKQFEEVLRTGFAKPMSCTSPSRRRR